MIESPQQPDERDPQLPDSLVAMLREQQAERPMSDTEPGVAPRIDDAVMRMARERLGEIDPPAPIRFPMMARAIAGVSVAAAAVALVVVFGPTLSGPRQNTTLSTEQENAIAQEDAADQVALEPRAEQRSFARLLDDTDEAERADLLSESDLFTDGVLARAAVPTAPIAFGTLNRVSIRDAHRLALALEAGAEGDSTLDANRDGVVNTDDVEALATQAVELGTRVSQLPVSPPPVSPWSDRFLGAWTLAHLTGSVTP